MIWANIQTLQHITETTGAIKDSVVNGAKSFGTSVSNGAHNAFEMVSDFFGNDSSGSISSTGAL